MNPKLRKVFFCRNKLIGLIILQIVFIFILSFNIKGNSKGRNKSAEPFIKTLNAGEAYIADTELSTLEPHLFYFQPNTDNKLTWKLLEGQIGSGDLDYEIINFKGAKISENKATTIDSIFINTTVNLPQGYYIIRFPNLNTQFGLSVLPYLNPDAIPDRFFAMHADLCHKDRLTYLSSQDKEIRHENLFKVLHKTGVRKVRDRVRPVQFAPNADSWSWSGTSYRYEDTRQLFDKYDIDLLGYFALSPNWMKRAEDKITGSNRNENKYPADLHAMTDTWLKIYERWQNELETIEIWNEPTGVTEDRLAPLVNAMTYRFQAAGYHDVDLATAAFAGLKERYTEHLGDMKVYDGIDKITFHTYANPDQTVNRTRFYMDAPAKFGYPNMPVSITEAGQKYVGGLWPTLDQEKYRCEMIIGNAVEARASGNTGYYSFIFKAAQFEEGDNVTQHSMIDIYGTPYLSMAAYAHAIIQLSHKDYLGDLQINHHDVIRARVFGDGENAVAAITSDNSPGISINAPVQDITGIDGRKISPDDNGNIPMEDDIMYLTFKQSDVEDLVDSETKAMALYQRSQQSSELPPRKTYPVVLQHFADYDHLEFGSPSYNMATIIDQDVTLTFQVSNMSDQQQDVEVELELPQFLTTRESLAKSVTLPANSKQKIFWTIQLDRDEPGFQGNITLGPSNDYDTIVSPVKFGIKCPRPVEEVLNSFDSYRKIDIYDESEWSKAGTSTIDLDIDVKDNSVKFGLWVADNRSWSMGRYDISGYDLTQAKGLLVVAREDIIPDNVSRFWPKVKFGIEEHSGADYFSKPIPNDGETHWTYIEFDAMPVNVDDNNQTLDVEDIKNFLVHTWHGMTDRTVHYEVFDLYMVSDSSLFRDTVFNINIQVIDTYTGDPMNNTKVTFDGKEYYTNSEGIINVQNVSFGFHKASVNKKGYVDIENKYVETKSDTTFVFQMHVEPPDITLQVIDRVTEKPVNRARITINDATELTSDEGKIIYEDIQKDKIAVSVEHKEYFSFSDTLFVLQDSLFTIQLTPTFADITFIVEDSLGPLSNVNVEFAERSGFTDNNGEVLFYRQPARQYYHYSVMEEHYMPVEDSIYLEIDTSLTLSLHKADTSKEDSVTSINDHPYQLARDIKIYPNPLKSKLNIQFPYPAGNGKIMDVKGRMVINRKLIQGKNTLNVDRLSKGYYILLIRFENGMVYRSLVK